MVNLIALLYTHFVLRYKHEGRMIEIKTEFQYKMAKEELEDGIRLVLWAQDSKVIDKYEGL